MPGNEDLAYLQEHHVDQHTFEDIKQYVQDLQASLAFVTQHKDEIKGDERAYFAVLFSLATAGEIMDQLVKGYDEHGNNEVVSRLGLQELGHAPEGDSRNNIQHRGKLVGIRDRIVHYQSKTQKDKTCDLVQKFITRDIPALEEHLEGLSQWLDGNGEHPQPFALRDFGKELLAELNDYAGKDSKLSQYTHEQQLQYYSASLLTQLDKIDRFTGSNLLQIGMADDVQYYAVQQSLVMSGKMARNLGKELGGEHELSESLAEISNNSNRLIHRYGDTDATIVRKACASLAEIEPHLNDLNHATSLPAKTQQAATAGPAFADKRQRSPTPPEEGAVNMGAAMAAIVAGKVPPASLDPPPGDDRVKAPITPIDAKAQAIKRAAIGERK